MNTLQKYKEVAFFWILLGPVFLLLSLALTVFYSLSYPALWSIAAVGPLICYYREKKGLYLMFALLASVSLYKHLSISENHLILLGIEVSIALGLLSSFSSIEYIKHLLDGQKDCFGNLENEKGELNQKLSEKKERMLRYKEDTKKEFDALENQILSLNGSIEVLRKNDHGQKVVLLEKELTKLQNKKKNLMDSLNFFRVEYYQMQLLYDAAVSELKNQEQKFIASRKKADVEKLKCSSISQELLQARAEVEKSHKRMHEYQQSISDKQSLLIREKDQLQSLLDQKKDLLEEKLQEPQELKKYKALYNQLRSQFFEKNKQLHTARKEVFAVQEKLLAKEHAEKEKDYCKDPSYDLLIKELKDLLEQSTLHEKENEHLIELISTMIKPELPPVKKRVIAIEQDLPFSLDMG